MVAFVINGQFCSTLERNPFTLAYSAAEMGVDALTQWFAMFDANGDQQMDYAEFKMMYEVSEIHFPFLGAQPLQLTLSLVTQVMMNGAQGDQNAKMQFDVVDTDGELLLTFEEMRAVHENMGAREEDTRMMLSHGDADGDGMLNFEEFKVINKMQRNQG